MRLLNWNLMWASPTTPRGEELLRRIRKSNPDVATFTETTVPFLDQLGGHVVLAHRDYGYQSPAIRRKVTLWSRTPWEDIDVSGHENLPGGRFAAATTNTDIGKVRILGLGIPWSHAHVATGRKDRRAWQDHLTYLEGMKEMVANISGHTILTGDFNQRIPRKRQLKAAATQLERILAPFNCVTTGPITPLREQTIDHVVLTKGLTASKVRAISNYKRKLCLSDHFGVECVVQLCCTDWGSR